MTNDPFVITVEPAQEFDPAEGVRLISQALKEKDDHRGGPQAQRAEWAAWRQPDARLAELTAGDRLLFGTIDGVPVGMAAYTPRAEADGSTTALVEVLYVEPEARGVSVGQHLMEATMQRASAAGCTQIEALALPGDRSTKNFFESFGLKARLLTVQSALE